MRLDTVHVKLPVSKYEGGLVGVIDAPALIGLGIGLLPAAGLPGIPPAGGLGLGVSPFLKVEDPGLGLVPVRV